ncbi:hypothetical protein FAZ69_27920 [Trinickia terrae]|uniref:Uncharacterized protein n=1 Tax=Trinickia terrae TaxID=2571161 RepID=A0A4U1HPQ6_9BURK|nr:hypothetical protein [Trinickia terrae]TKC81454.1 hypothetical protein FAZ69_27920 [Trinickia terrae]
MFDLGETLLTPDRRPVLLPDVSGSRGLMVVGVGRGAERGFQMVYRFHDAGTQLASNGVNLVFVYPKESARHVLDPMSVACVQFQRHPQLLLDAEGRFFGRVQPVRSLTAAHLNGAMATLGVVTIDMLDRSWENEFRMFLSMSQIGTSY